MVKSRKQNKRLLICTKFTARNIFLIGRTLMSYESIVSNKFIKKEESSIRNLHLKQLVEETYFFFRRTHISLNFIYKIKGKKQSWITMITNDCKWFVCEAQVKIFNPVQPLIKPSNKDIMYKNKNRTQYKNE